MEDKTGIKTTCNAYANGELVANNVDVIIGRFDGKLTVQIGAVRYPLADTFVSRAGIYFNGTSLISSDLEYMTWATCQYRTAMAERYGGTTV